MPASYNEHTQYIRNGQAKGKSVFDWANFFKEVLIWFIAFLLSVVPFVCCLIIRDYLMQQLPIIWFDIFGRQPDLFLLYTTLAITPILTLAAHKKSNKLLSLVLLILGVCSFVAYIVVFFKWVNMPKAVSLFSLICFIAMVLLELVVCYKENKR